MKREKKLNIAI